MKHQKNLKTMFCQTCVTP